MRLSLCIATFNEEKNIHYPLDSAYDLADEVIIVDGGSTDKTTEKARAYGKKVKIIKAPNPPMFHINKQKAIEEASGDWILQLDADEALSKELKEEIASLLDGYMTTYKKNEEAMKQGDNVAYWIPRKNWFLTRFLTKGGQYPDYTIRLYRNGSVRFPLKSVHENVELNLHPRGESWSKEHLRGDVNDKDAIGFFKNPILHYPDPDFSRYLKRWDRYTSLDAKILAKETKQWSNGAMEQFFMFLKYFIIKPKLTFYSMYFRHLGFMDGFPGFVFALFSAIRFWAIYIKFKSLQKS